MSSPARERPAGVADGLALAFGLLTILPTPTVRSGEQGLGGAAVWFPLVGAAVGALAGGVRLATQGALGSPTASALALAALVVLSGALHQDGLADTADGLGARGGGRERRLAAMRDSSTGAFGVLALVWWGLLALTAVASFDSAQALRALTMAGAISRWAALVHAATADPARRDGLGAAFQPSAGALAVAGAVTAAAAVVWCGAALAAALLAAALLVATGVSAFARRTLGGRTGDTLGATVALAELAVLLVALAWR